MRRLRDLVPGLILFALGVSLLALAIPRTVAAWIALDAHPAMARLEIGDTANAAELRACVDAYQDAQRWLHSSGRFASLSTCEFALALAAAAAADDPARQEWLARAEEHLEQGLLMNPAEPYAWMRLASVRSLRGASGRTVVTALLMSVDMGPNVRVLLRQRSRMLLFYVPQMTVEELFTVRHHLRTIWTNVPSERPNLFEAAYTLNRVGMLQWVLEGDREAMDELRMMERQSRFP